MASDLSMDVVIAGGGLAGMPLACALGAAGISVALIEPTPPEKLVTTEFDGRTTAVAASSARMFESLGAWDDVAPHAQPILDIRVADAESPFFVHYDHKDVGADALGWIVENKDLRAAMLPLLDALPTVRFLPGLRVTEFETENAWATVDLSDGTMLGARLLVGADGRQSPTRRRAGIGVTKWRYDQHAIICTVVHERDHRGIAHEHFLPSGPFAILPLTGNRSSIVWTERADLAPHFMNLPDGDFLEELSSRFGNFLGALSLEGPRRSYPLGLMNARSYIAPRIALVADAAHTIHPIAGQGINIGWRDVAALAEVVADTMRLGLDPGDLSSLEKYQSWRRTDNAVMLAATDALNRLFSNDAAPLVAARNLGLAAVQRAPAVKKLFMRHAMGELGDLPRLIRGLPV